MYNQVYFHKTATACEAMLSFLNQKCIHLFFPLDIDSYISIDDYNILEFFYENTFIKNNSFMKKFVRELLFERKLWKRVYEETVPFHLLTSSPSLCHKVLQFLKEQDIPTELIESSANLTRFSPKGKGDASKNNFKVILKNASTLGHTVEPIENHSNLINRVDEEFVIKRVFVAKYTENGEEIDPKSIQKIISERILK